MNIMFRTINVFRHMIRACMLFRLPLGSGVLK